MLDPFNPDQMKPLALAFCDEIQHEIVTHLRERTRFAVTAVKMDLSESGAFQSTKKFITIEDTNGKLYKITIEEAKGGERI